MEIIEKIKKLLRLGNSEQNDSAAEASSALRKAMQLMKEHNVSEAQLSASQRLESIGHTEVDFTLRTKNIPYHISLLADLIDRLFECKHYWDQKISYKGRRGTYQTTPRFIGEYPHHQVAAYTFEVLAREVDRARSAYKPPKMRGKNLSYARNGFAIGWVEAVEAKILDMVPPERVMEPDPDTGIVPVDPRLIYRNELAGRVSYQKTRSMTYLRDSLAPGREAGSRVQINRGLGNAAKKLR